MAAHLSSGGFKCEPKCATIQVTVPHQPLDAPAKNSEVREHRNIAMLDSTPESVPRLDPATTASPSRFAV